MPWLCVIIFLYVFFFLVSHVKYLIHYVIYTTEIKKKKVNLLVLVFVVTFDIVFTWKARKTMSFNQKLRFVVKFVIAATWTITLPVSYASSTRNCSETSFDDFCLSTYIITVGIYLASNVIGSAFFLVPAVTNYIETSNWCVCKFLSWYAQVCFLYFLILRLFVDLKLGIIIHELHFMSCFTAK